MKSYFILILTSLLLISTSVKAQDDIHYDGSSQVYWAVVKETIDLFTKETGIKVIAEDRKTQDAVPSLISGRSNVGGIARKMTLAEKSQGTDLVEILIAKDHIAVFVPAKSKVEELSMLEIKKIFSGEIKNWKEIGDDSGDIVIVIPQIKTACNKNFAKIVMKDASFSNSSVITETAGAVLETAKGKRGISFISYGAVMNKADFKVLKINGKNPGTEGYPIGQEFYFVTKGAPSGNVKKYIDFFLSGSGKDFIKKVGLIQN
ncbi:MAG: substrate-binding domain-containing protein [Desulfobacterales bacterium]|nr:substrate-binding domain-containing protein [Desulfobacterales bacterium]